MTDLPALSCNRPWPVDHEDTRPSVHPPCAWASGLPRLVGPREFPFSWGPGLRVCVKQKAGTWGTGSKHTETPIGKRKVVTQQTAVKPQEKVTTVGREWAQLALGSCRCLTHHWSGSVLSLFALWLSHWIPWQQGLCLIHCVSQIITLVGSWQGALESL